MPVDHWMMFSTFAEQRYFVYPDTRTYSGAVINGNMAAHAPTGLAAFLLERTADLPYVIDPLTHAFQHDPAYIQNDVGEPKSSISKLAEAYGEPIAKLAGARPLLPKDLKDKSLLRSFVGRCVAFQKDQLATAMLSSPAMKYLDKTVEQLRPAMLVAPYFYMTETTVDPWLPLAVESIRCTREAAGGLPVFGAVVVGQGVIHDRSVASKIITALADSDVAGFFLWIDDLDEHEAGIAELGGAIALARGLRGKNSKAVINLHGGYFSVLAGGVLGNQALTGVTHGPEFGESRSVIPVGGGIPIARYYVPLLHARVKYRDAVRYLRAKKWFESAETFHAHVCMCEECKETLSGDVARFVEFGRSEVKTVRRGSGVASIEFPTPATKERCLRHYLQRKKIEYQFASGSTEEVVVSDLKQGYLEFEDAIGLEGVAHLERWARVFGKSLLPTG